MLTDFSFILVKRNITNEYSDYHFHVYLGNLPDQTLGYHRECYTSWVLFFIHTQERSTMFPNQRPKQTKT